MAERPPRLSQVFQKHDGPLYFVTFNTAHRAPLLASEAVHSAFRDFGVRGLKRGVAIGRYVLMPDHCHLFVKGGAEFVLVQWMRMLKRALSSSIAAALPHWQEGFFDHLMRSAESYAQKWAYVRENPVRAGLAVTCESWPFQGEVEWLPYC